MSSNNSEDIELILKKLVLKYIYNDLTVGKLCNLNLDCIGKYGLDINTNDIDTIKNLKNKEDNLKVQLNNYLTSRNFNPIDFDIPTNIDADTRTYIEYYLSSKKPNIDKILGISTDVKGNKTVEEKDIYNIKRLIMCILWIREIIKTEKRKTISNDNLEKNQEFQNNRLEIFKNYITLDNIINNMTEDVYKWLKGNKEEINKYIIVDKLYVDKIIEAYEKEVKENKQASYYMKYLKYKQKYLLLKQNYM